MRLNQARRGPQHARALAALRAAPYFSTPTSTTWAWSTRGWRRAGIAVVRGDLAARTSIAFWLKDQRVVAGMNANVWDVTESIQALIRSGRPVDPARLADPDIPWTR